MDPKDQTSIPGQGTDPLEADFEKMLQDEGLELQGRNKPEEKKPDAPAEEKKPDDEKKPDEGDDSKKDGKKPDEKKPEKDDEEWRRMVAKRHREKSKSDGEDGKKPAEPVKPDPSKPNTEDKKPDAPELTAEQKTLADKYGIEHDDYFKMFPQAVVKEVIKNGLSDEQQGMLETITRERNELLIEKGYNADFNKNVLPLIREEYPTISEDKIEEIRANVRKALEDPKFSMTPLEILYRGDKTFRGIVKTEKKGPDQGSQMPAKGNSGKVYDFENATEEDIKKSDFPFEEYSAYMEKKERAQKRS